MSIVAGGKRLDRALQPADWIYDAAIRCQPEEAGDRHGESGRDQQVSARTPNRGQAGGAGASRQLLVVFDPLIQDVGRPQAEVREGALEKTVHGIGMPALLFESQDLVYLRQPAAV